MPDVEKQRLAAVMSGIRELRKARSIPPTVRELAAHLERPLSAVHYDLRTLRREGRVEWEDRKPRTLRVVRKTR